MPETFSNGGAAVVGAGGIDASATTLPTSGRSNLPASGTFRVRVGDEILKVTAGGQSAASWTVERGAEGTTATTHAAGAAIRHVLTAGGLRAALSEVESGGEGGPGGGTGGGGAYGVFTPFVMSEWTLDDPAPAITVFHRVAGQPDTRIIRTSGAHSLADGRVEGMHIPRVGDPSKNYCGNAIACYQVPLLAGASKQRAGIALRVPEDVPTYGGRLVAFGYGPDGDGTPSLFIDTYADRTTLSPTNTPAKYELPPGQGSTIWLRIGFNPWSAIMFWYSLDGVYWLNAGFPAMSNADLDFYGSTFFGADAPTSLANLSEVLLYYTIMGSNSAAEWSAARILSFRQDASEYYECDYPGTAPIEWF